MAELERMMSDEETDRIRQKLENFKRQSADMQKRRDDAVSMATPPDGIQCNRCGNTGYIMTIDSDGYETAVPCPDCFAQRQVVRRLHQSGVNPEDYKRYTLDDFRPDTDEAAKMKAMAERYLQEYPAGVGFGVFGKSGTGKTHLCIAICQEITKRHNEPHFYFSYRSEMPALIQAMKSYKTDYDAAIKKWKECKNLYIDDLFKLSGTLENGRLISIGQDDLKVMFDILNARYLNHLRTILSSEYSVKEIADVDGALGSRIYEMVKPYGLHIQSGKNRRLEKVTA